ncbi:acyl-CoA dehydrogenase family protein [Neobacillus novalis]|uniref:Acyl-CoA dehydrogenase family protein n=1 Tax=Neobacillus novalis TaxID=220687 RepID=A0AA95S992_9BACI|nr:acyl-CoA dehydrogenase family protein [Neobacillus novalis]WHY83999.1 acyl-CoA dehydrogenase family protein [Neobacillus novalis]
MNSIFDDFKLATKRFAKEQLSEIAKEFDENEAIDPSIIEKLKEQGYTSMMYPAENGGAEVDLDTVCAVVEEIAKYCASTAITLVGHLTGSVACLVGGNHEQKERFVYPNGRKNNLFAVSISEPGAGSDVTSIRTTAHKKDGGYVLNGSKCFVTNGGLADVYVIFARTDQTDRKGGLSAFIVPKETEGLHVGKKEKKMGLRGSYTTDLYLENAWIPEEQLIGMEGDGFSIIEKTMDRTRVVVAAHALGIASGALEFAVIYASERKQFGRTIGEFQGLQFMIADMSIKEETARRMVYYAAEQVINKNKIASYYSSIAKTVASDAAMEITTDAVQVLGGAGYIRDYPVERMMRDAKVTQIFEGTNQIQRMIIAKYKLKK